eukprot:PhM_4_TR3452/c3_g1_i2/m.62860
MPFFKCFLINFKKGWSTIVLVAAARVAVLLLLATLVGAAALLLLAVRLVALFVLTNKRRRTPHAALLVLVVVRVVVTVVVVMVRMRHRRGVVRVRVRHVVGVVMRRVVRGLVVVLVVVVHVAAGVVRRRGLAGAAVAGALVARAQRRRHEARLAAGVRGPGRRGLRLQLLALLLLAGHDDAGGGLGVHSVGHGLGGRSVDVVDNVEERALNTAVAHALAQEVRAVVHAQPRVGVGVPLVAAHSAQDVVRRHLGAELALVGVVHTCRAPGGVARDVGGVRGRVDGRRLQRRAGDHVHVGALAAVGARLARLPHAQLREHVRGRRGGGGHDRGRLHAHDARHADVVDMDGRAHRGGRGRGLVARRAAPGGLLGSGGHSILVAHGVVRRHLAVGVHALRVAVALVGVAVAHLVVLVVVVVRVVVHWVVPVPLVRRVLGVLLVPVADAVFRPVLVVVLVVVVVVAVLVMVVMMMMVVVLVMRALAALARGWGREGLEELREVNVERVVVLVLALGAFLGLGGLVGFGGLLTLCGIGGVGPLLLGLRLLGLLLGLLLVSRFLCLLRRGGLCRGGLVLLGIHLLSFFFEKKQINKVQKL